MPGFMRLAGTLGFCMVAGTFLAGSAVAARPANDDFANAKTISGRNGAIWGNNTRATIQPGEPGDDRTLWYRWRAPVSGWFLFSTEYSPNHPRIRMFRGSSLRRLRAIQPRYAKWAIVVRVSADRIYRVQLDSGYIEIGEVRLTWRRVLRPPNDRFADATAISGESGLVRSNNYAAGGERGEPEQEPVQQPGDIASVWFRWTAPTDGTYTFSAKESGFADAFVGVYAGDNVADLERVAATAFSRPVSLGASAGQTFRILVDSFWASVGRIVLRWNRKVEAPANDNFAARVPLAGSEGYVRGLYEDATMELNEPATGCGSVWYTWTAPETQPVLFTPGDGERGVFVFTGERVDALTEVSATLYKPGWDSVTGLRVEATAGTRYHIAYNDCWFDPFWFSWNQGGPPNDMFAAATVLQGWSGTVTGDKVLSGVEAGEGGWSQNSVWFRWTAPISGRATITTSGSSFDTSLEVYRGAALGALTWVAADDNSGPHYTSSATFDATAGTTYYVTVFGGEGSIVLNWNRSTGETVPPVVSLITPREGDRDGQIVGLEADAYDNTDIESVAFYARGTLVGRAVARKRVLWDTRGQPDGPAEIYAVARDIYGNEATSPTITMQVDNMPPETTITSGPSGTMSTRHARFAAESSEAGSSFQCSLDGAEFTLCSATVELRWLAKGRHRFAVRAKDAAGNTDGSPAARIWYVDP